MNAEEIIRFIHDAKKTTPVKAYVKAAGDVEFPGCRVFGAGDINHKPYRQITTAVSDGTIAALAAERWLRSRKK